MDYYFTKITKFADDNLRIIQYCVYCVGGIGAIVCFRSLRLTQRFTSAREIPDDFINKQIRLRGLVEGIATIPPRFTQTPVPPKRINENGVDKLQVADQLDQSVDEKPTTNHQHTVGPTINPQHNVSSSGSTYKFDEGIVKIYRKRITNWQSLWANPFSFLRRESEPTLKGVSSDEVQLYPLYLKVTHLPVISFKKKNNNQNPVLVKLSSVKVSETGVQKAEQEFKNQKIWFHVLKRDDEGKSISCIVRPLKGMFRKSYNEELVRRGLAYIDPIDDEMVARKNYRKFYRSLARGQEKANKIDEKTIVSRIWKKIFG